MTGPDSDADGGRGRDRLPCQICGGSRECDTPPGRLRMQIQGTQIRACPDCIQARDEHRIHIARNQPAFRVQPGTELADAFERIDDGLEQDGKGGRPWR